jgi:uncharacterized protein DUF3500
MRRLILLASLVVVFAASILFQSRLASQTPKAPPKRSPEELLRLSLAAEGPGLAEPFKGLTANGTIEPGLFTIRSTGVSTKPVKLAAQKFLAGLSDAQRKKTMYAVDDPEWRKWMNQSFYVRQGVNFLEMTPAQRELAFALFRSGLSAKGLTLTRDIMRLNETLGELTDGNFDEYGEFQYYVTIMGTPSEKEPWGCGSLYFTVDDVDALWDTISSMTSSPDANEFMRSRIDDGCHRRCSSEDWSADR